MAFIPKNWVTLLCATGRLGLFSLLVAPASAAEGGFSAESEMLPLVLAATALVVAAAGIIVGVRTQGVAKSALQEAGEARAKAQAAGQALSPESLASTERVWSARLSALEAQVHNLQPRNGLRASSSGDRQLASDLDSRIQDVEKALSGLATLVAQNRRPGGSALNLAPSVPELAWPTVLKAEKQGFKELRDLLQEGGKVSSSELEVLFHELSTAETWSAQRRPSLDELLSFLRKCSQAFHTVLRKGAAQPAHEGSRMADRLLGALRPVWQVYYPTVDCRIFYPGTPFDPEWMEDQNPTGARRPTISEMFSWAVHEKQNSGRKIIAKSRVTTE
ncbi:MAG: hypothetical protein ABIO94_05830 [Opitutaceae bacterium]